VPIYLGGDLQFPVELEDGRFEVLKRKATEKREEPNLRAQVDITIEAMEVSTQSGTATSLESFTDEDIESRNTKTESSVEGGEV
jgi:hypothetical protein